MKTNQTNQTKTSQSEVVQSEVALESTGTPEPSPAMLKLLEVCQATGLSQEDLLYLAVKTYLASHYGMQID